MAGSRIEGKPARLGDQLYGAILDGIVSGTYREGDKLPSESRICADFGVSRPVVREALMRLNADGLVTTRQGSGTFVQRRPPGQLTRLAKISDIAGLLRCMEVRIGLESQAAGLAARRHTAESLARIGRALDALRRGFERGEAMADADLAFHRAVAAASGNALFGELLEGLHDAMHGMMTVALGITRAGSHERAQRVMEEHEAITDMIRRGDAEGATLAMRYHLHRARQRVTDGQQDV